MCTYITYYILVYFIKDYYREYHEQQSYRVAKHPEF